MLRSKVRFRGFAIVAFCLAMATFPCVGVSQDVLGDAFKRFDVEQPPTKPDAKPKNALRLKTRGKDDASKDADQKKGEKGLDNKELLKAFYKEMEALAEGTDEFSEIVKSVKKELKAEFQANEDSLSKLSATELAGAPAIGLLDRQKVIAQLYIEVGSRTGSSNSRSQYELQRKISNRFREFCRKHKEAASDPNFHRKEQEIVSKIQRRGFGQMVQTMATTMEELADGELVRPKFRSTRVHPGEEAGALQQNRPVLRKLLRLKWDGPHLVLDRAHWDDAYAGRNVEDIRIEVNDILRSAGAKTTGESEEALRRRQFAARANQNQQYSNIARLFDELRGTNSRSYSRGASGDNVQSSFSNGMITSRLKTTGTSFEFVFEENAKPKRFLRMLENDEGLQIMLVGDMVVHRFRQDTDAGKLTVVEVVGDDVVSLGSDSFAGFYRQHPRFVEDRFFALLDHVGIVAPESRFDRRIVSRVVEYLKMDRDKLRVEVDELVEQLDAKRFTTREAAYEKLRNGLDKYYDMLYSRKSDKTLSAEVKARVGKLLSLSEQGSASHYDTVISSLGLVDDLEYLQELRDVSDSASQAILDKRIGHLLTK